MLLEVQAPDRYQLIDPCWMNLWMKLGALAKENDRRQNERCAACTVMKRLTETADLPVYNQRIGSSSAHSQAANDKLLLLLLNKWL